jgi:SH3-like domain-containing protein
MRAQAEPAGVRAFFSKYVYVGQRNLSAAVLVFVMCPFGAAWAQDLPLPRFASLKADEVNLRAGPGQSYQIEWVFTRKGLPVEIVAEYDQWRKIQDVDGTVGWVHRVMLSGQRAVLIAGVDVVTAFDEPANKNLPVFQAEPGVQGRLLRCEDDWCRIDVDGAKGWLPMASLWGVYPSDNAE